jgi:IS6 family transposase
MLPWLLFGDVRGDARIVERAFGIGPSALTEVVVMLAQNLDAKTA